MLDVKSAANTTKVRSEMKGLRISLTFNSDTKFRTLFLINEKLDYERLSERNDEIFTSCKTLNSEKSKLHCSEKFDFE